MPVVTCLLFRGHAAVREAVLAHPRWQSEAFLLRECPGIRVPPEGLLLVKCADAFTPRWGGDEPQTASHAFASKSVKLAVPLAERFHWLQSALPPISELESLREFAIRTHQAAAWFFWFERGDDLYADAAWVYDPQTTHLISPGVTLTSASAGEFAWARQTYLMGKELSASLEVEADRIIQNAESDSPLKAALLRLGMTSTAQYLISFDHPDFDWESCRLGRIE